MDISKDYYKILDVIPTATPDDIKKAYEKKGRIPYLYNYYDGYEIYDCYKILGVSFGATDKEIHDAFREKQRDSHVDINHGIDPELSKKINKAYDILKDTRTEYDLYYKEICNINEANEVLTSTQRERYDYLRKCHKDNPDPPPNTDPPPSQPRYEKQECPQKHRCNKHIKELTLELKKLNRYIKFSMNNKNTRSEALKSSIYIFLIINVSLTFLSLFISEILNTLIEYDFANDDEIIYVIMLLILPFISFILTFLISCNIKIIHRKAINAPNRIAEIEQQLRKCYYQCGKEKYRTRAEKSYDYWNEERF